MPGVLRPQLEELTAKATAAQMGQPYSTVARWLAAWLAEGVEGIRTVRSRGRGGESYRVAADLIERWRAGDLPEPRLAT